MGFDEAMEAEVQQEKPQYEEPEAQKALNGTYTTFFVRAFKEGEKPIVEQHQ